MYYLSSAREVCLSTGVGSVIPRLVAALFVLASVTFAQNVTTQHNDISRTGANTSETVLTPSNVNSTSFGKLFYYVVDGYIYAQPLYMANVTIGGAKHNVVFVATEHDSVYAFDADSNLGTNGKPLWQVTLLDTAHGATTSTATPEPSSDFGYTDLVPEVGITSTPVIDSTTGTLYVVGKTKENGNYFYRLHALDITTGKEQFGGPITITGSVQGTGSGSSNGALTFNPTYQLQRPGLLLLNGIVYVAFGATYDVTTIWHGWIYGYKNNGTSLQQTGVWTGSPNGNGASIWLSGAGLAADVVDPTGHPFGRLFTGTGNGNFNATTPYTNAMNYGISVIRLDLANGVPSMNTNGVQVGDMFAPFNQASLDNNDQDMASGGTMILPDVVVNGKTSHFLVTSGKSGLVYLLDRDNLGGFNPNNTSDPQAKASVGGSIYGMPAYWNGHIYYWPAAGSGGGALKSFSFSGGTLSSQPTSSSAELSAFPGPSPSVSANGTTNGIVWSVRTDGFASGGPAILYAHNAASSTSTLPLLYSSTQDAARDTPGAAVKFATPTITNGKVYVGTQKQLAIYGLLNGATQAPAPAITPTSQQFHPSIQVTITDSNSSAQIFYTTDGSMPSTGSTLYTGPFTVSSTTTVNAIAAGSGLIASTVSKETYTLINQVPTPVFNPEPGDYTSAQSATIPSPWPNSTTYYTTDGTTPTTSSDKYGGPIAISTTTTLKAMATASGLTQSNVASGVYTIVTNATSSIDFSNGFKPGSMALVGRAGLSGTDVRLTDGGVTEAGAAWYPIKVNVQSFATDFTFQQTPGTIPRGDGLTFAIQGVSTSALGPNGGGLGYGPSQVGGTGGIPNSVAVKFALFNNGKCNNCTGFYTNGAPPTLPEVTLGGGVNLQTGDVFAVHISYDGTTLTMTITDTSNSETFTTSWPVNIPGTVGGNTAYVGFTGGTGRYTLVQDILSWTYVSNAGSQPPPAATPVISPATGAFTSPQTVTITDATAGSTYYTLDGSQPTTSSTAYTGSFTVNTTTTVKAIATAANFTQSSTATSVITINQQSAAATPAISPATGTFSSAQTVTITDATSGATIFYTLDGSQPTTTSTQYTSSFTVSTTTTVKAIATASGFAESNTATSVITIQSGSPTINLASGFTAAGLSFNGRAKLNGTRLRLTDGGQGEASSSWFTTPVNVQSFTTDFNLQLTNPNADGMAFVIQNAGTAALGSSGGGLGYASSVCGSNTGILKSVAVKFDLFQNCQEGNNSTGLYTNGASPTGPAVPLGGGVNLHSGDTFHVHMTYDGTTLTMTITDTMTNATFTTSWTVNIPAAVGADTAFVGFTGGTGGQTATQEVITWTYGP